VAAPSDRRRPTTFPPLRSGSQENTLRARCVHGANRDPGETDAAIGQLGVKHGRDAKALRKAMEPLAGAGWQVSGRLTRGNAKRGGHGVDNQAVRTRAASNGIELSPRGRIPADVIEKYRAAGNSSLFASAAVNGVSDVVCPFGGWPNPCPARCEAMDDPRRRWGPPSAGARISARLAAEISSLTAPNGTGRTLVAFPLAHASNKPTYCQVVISAIAARQRENGSRQPNSAARLSTSASDRSGRTPTTQAVAPTYTATTVPGGVVARAPCSKATTSRRSCATPSRSTAARVASGEVSPPRRTRSSAARRRAASASAVARSSAEGSPRCFHPLFSASCGPPSPGTDGDGAATAGGAANEPEHCSSEDPRESSGAGRHGACPAGCRS
jgi:hypothetical protein